MFSINDLSLLSIRYAVVISHAEHLLANRSIAELGTSCVMDLVGQTVEMLVLFD